MEYIRKARTIVSDVPRPLLLGQYLLLASYRSTAVESSVGYGFRCCENFNENQNVSYFTAK